MATSESSWNRWFGTMSRKAPVRHRSAPVTTVRVSATVICTWSMW